LVYDTKESKVESINIYIRNPRNYGTRVLEDTITYNGEMAEKAAVGLETKDVV
jgi:hypothetical protein